MDLHYSQTITLPSFNHSCLNPLWIYTTLKLPFIQIKGNPCLNPLWIYTTLKHIGKLSSDTISLNPLWIYTTLKL